MDYKRIESELRCVVCCDLFKYPVMLPCGHNICAGCSDKCLSNPNSAAHITVSSPASSTSSSNSQASRRLSQESLEKLQQGDGVDKDVHSALESDQISMVSDADSGVVCGSSASNKRDSFLSANGSERGLSSLTCPYSRCQKVFLSEEGKASFPPNRLMMKILSKYTSSMLSSPVSTPTSSSAFPPLCQLCDNDSGKVAVVFCQQCDIYYCQACRDSFHPQRGPLVAHKLLPLDKGSSPGLSPAKDSPQQQLLLHNTYVSAALEQQKCPLHSHEYTMYCTPCRLPLCWRCLEKDTLHQEQHDVQSLQGLSKAKKAEFSRALQLLSEKSKRMTEWICRVKTASARIAEVELDIEASITAQCDDLIGLVQDQKHRLLQSLHCFKDHKLQEARDNATECTSTLQQATAQIQFGIEVLKETEAVNFLQFSAPLHMRIAETSLTLEQQLKQPWSPELSVRFDSRPLLHMLQNLQLQQVVPPSTPRLNIEDCRIVNGHITLSWASQDQQNTDFYILEIAESGNPFTTAYHGPDTCCSLNFASHNMIYQARLKAVNIAGESPYSNIATLHVEGGYFTWDTSKASSEVIVGNDGLTLTSSASEDLVVLGTSGFVQGVHYWEVHVDRYDNHPDPAFGIATASVKRDSMLGKDSNAWALYIDMNRSWCIHSNKHVNRQDGGISAGCVVGLLLDLDERTLSFYVNDEPQAPIPAFDNLPQGLVFYPAVSINRNVQVTLRPCLDPPSPTSSPA